MSFASRPTLEEGSNTANTNLLDEAVSTYAKSAGRTRVTDDLEGTLVKVQLLAHEILQDQDFVARTVGMGDARAIFSFVALLGGLATRIS